MLTELRSLNGGNIVIGPCFFVFLGGVGVLGVLIVCGVLDVLDVLDVGVGVLVVSVDVFISDVADVDCFGETIILGFIPGILFLCLCIPSNLPSLLRI